MILISGKKLGNLYEVNANQQRVVIVFPLSASISLFCNILLNPHSSEAAGDLALMSRAPASIFQLSTKQPSRKELTQYYALVRFTTELSRLANQAIGLAHGE
jgi:hypothetical protein